ncbi:NADPH:quinone oxidoreductase family protein [Salinibacterium sp. SYSU T00001]|uniref:NADPH:quinone oxidoreductase family protein n=1 Tax=Homoserinimonas sedimenticola TaxID=2986805 RepID=UPI002235AB27|nr:NADPH:quinone oxidoreductase family protein [Salinibacterium sedimenticola]MCW4386079.1 NADPH:quinone oxidoreductase family protein [Salinibacterium sedimenticola]
MRAWQVTAHGEPRDVMKVVEIDEPAPGAGEVALRTRAVAINFPDVLLSRGEYQVKPELPFSPGIEVCGEVVALGEGVEGFAVGDRVISSHIGVMAETVVVPAASTFPAPEGLTDAEASALIIGHQTGWFGLHRRGQLQAGETLLVHAAAGGVGTAAVQLGKAAGATVIGVVGSEAKRQVALDAGADVVVNRRDEDFVAVVNEHTGGRGADVIYDPVGGETFQRSTKCIAFEGRIIVVGFAGGEIQSAKANHALVKNYSVVGLHWGLYQSKAPELVPLAHQELTRLANEGAIRPLVSEVVPFADAADAVQRLGDGSTVGRLVVDFSTS